MGLLILQMPCECHVKSMQLAINSCTLFISRLLFFISHECVCVFSADAAGEHGSPGESEIPKCGQVSYH